MKAVTADILKLFGFIYNVKKNDFPKGNGSSKINAVYYTVVKTEITKMEATRLQDGTSSVKVNERFDFPIGQFGPREDVIETGDSFLAKFFAYEEDAQSIARTLTEVELTRIVSAKEEEMAKVNSLIEIESSLKQQLDPAGLGFND